MMRGAGWGKSAGGAQAASSKITQRRTYNIE
jgi:hypothetical protein